MTNILFFIKNVLIQNYKLQLYKIYLIKRIFLKKKVITVISHHYRADASLRSPRLSN